SPSHPLTDREYHALADSVMEYLEHTLEEIGEEANITGFDVVVAAGVLNLSLGDMGTYVINKQPPNKQIWLSSPISGPKRFDYVPATKHWTYLRTGERLADLLSAELSAHLKQEVKLSEDL
ncbi:uncharacterized protein EV422DRAFT_498959, partial [Fimicolochytrium jonesii]|uniref:uncharacterized protein n=1 Tax=Fimicolochytrium jonesii TaxID=1396493 RepID=UPI0022FE8376